MLIFFLMNSVVLLSAFLITYKVLRISNFIDSLICWFLVYFAQIVLAELLLGIISSLFLWNLILLNVAILLVVYLATKNATFDFSFSGISEIISKLLQDKLIFFSATIIFAFALVKLTVNLLNPPFGWDSLNYHFTFPVEWLKHGNLDNPITIFDDPSPSYYPINGSLYYLWLIFPLKSVFLADLGQTPFFVLAFLAVYSISRKVLLSREKSFCAAVLLTLIPNYFKQLQIAYVDVMVVALFLASLNFMFLLENYFDWQIVLMYGLSMGLLVGVKTVALPYSFLLFLPFVYFAIKNKIKLPLLLGLISIIILFGGFSYIRNFFETGNPLYPFNLRVFGATVFKGVMDSKTYGAHFTNADYRLSKVLFHEGLGVQTMLFVLPALFLAFPFVVNRKKRTFALVYFSLLPALMYLAYRYLIPLANVRYLYPLLGMGMILALFVADVIHIPKVILRLLIFICVLVSMTELAKRQELISSVLLTIFILLFYPYLKRIIIWTIYKVKPVFAIPSACVFLLILLIPLSDWYIKNEYPRYKKMVKYSGFWPDATEAWEWLNQNTVGNNIAYAGRPVPFPLYGGRFKNNVYYVSVNKTDPAKLHDFKNSFYNWGRNFESLHNNLEAKTNYRGNAVYSDWSNNLMKRKIDFLFVYSLHQTKEIKFPIEDKWAAGASDKFVPVFKNATIHIYKLL